MHKDVMKAIRNMEPAWESERGRKFALSQIREQISTMATSSTLLSADKGEQSHLRWEVRLFDTLLLLYAFEGHRDGVAVFDFLELHRRLS